MDLGPLFSLDTQLYFSLNIIQLPRGLKIIKHSVPLLNFPFKDKLHSQNGRVWLPACQLLNLHNSAGAILDSSFNQKR